jgi:hypothetical protein
VARPLPTRAWTWRYEAGSHRYEITVTAEAGELDWCGDQLTGLDKGVFDIGRQPVADFLANGPLHGTPTPAHVVQAVEAHVAPAELPRVRRRALRPSAFPVPRRLTLVWPEAARSFAASVEIVDDGSVVYRAWDLSTCAAVDVRPKDFPKLERALEARAGAVPRRAGGPRAIYDRLLELFVRATWHPCDRGKPSRSVPLDLRRELLAAGVGPFFLSAASGMADEARPRGGPDLSDPNGVTLLFESARRGNEPVVRALLMSGANPDAAEHKGYGPLHVAALLGREAIVRALIAAGADVNARTRAGDTPLDLATRPLSYDDVEVLTSREDALRGPRMSVFDDVRAGSGDYLPTFVSEARDDGTIVPPAAPNEAVVRALLDAGALPSRSARP